MTAATATVVVIARDRWAQSVECLDRLLHRTDARHGVIVVDAHAPRRVAEAFDRIASTGRVRVVRRKRFLASNEARNAGADGIRTEWIAVVENDVTLNDGWLETLLDAGERFGADSVYPAYLMPGPDGPVVHGLGAELVVSETLDSKFVREYQHDVGRPWRDVAAEIRPVERVMAEPHAFVIRRELLERMGGFDEGFLSWFEHIDLALHHQRLSASAWLIPDATCLYEPAPPSSVSDRQSFALRWGREWYERSLDHLCTTWGLDRADSEWAKHQRYRHTVRRTGLPNVRGMTTVIDRSAEHAERALARRWERQRSRMAS